MGVPSSSVKPTVSLAGIVSLHTTIGLNGSRWAIAHGQEQRDGTVNVASTRSIVMPSPAWTTRFTTAVIDRSEDP